MKKQDAGGKLLRGVCDFFYLVCNDIDYDAQNQEDVQANGDPQEEMKLAPAWNTKILSMEFTGFPDGPILNADYCACYLTLKIVDFPWQHYIQGVRDSACNARLEV